MYLICLIIILRLYFKFRDTYIPLTFYTWYTINNCHTVHKWRDKNMEKVTRLLREKRWNCIHELISCETLTPTTDFDADRTFPTLSPRKTLQTVQIA